MAGGGYVKGKQRTVDTSRFAMVPRSDLPRSAFDIQHGHKTTLNAAYLVPVYVDEVLPGDSFRLRMTAFARLATPIVPVMDNIWLESFFFFVPYRLLWTNFERFMGEQLTPADTTAFLIPQLPIVDADCAVGTLVDYFGLTVNNAVGTLNVSALPFRAYGLIYNDWFRDENLINPMVLSTGDGPDTVAQYPIMRRGKRHDYFTTCLPWPQKPLSSAAFNTGTGSIDGTIRPGGTGGNWFTSSSVSNSYGVGAPVTGLGFPAGGASFGATAVQNTGSRVYTQPENYRTSTTQLYVEKAVGSDFPNIRVLINDMRTANMLQIMMERNARGGTRYSELVRRHFGVTSPDARLQRPEYLGGGRTQVVVNPVAQTSETTAEGVLGELAGIGTAMVVDHGFSASFAEHGVILGLVHLRADLSYQQGVERMWSRRTMYDFYWPGLANLGEQAVMSREIFADGSASDGNVFGYQERWAEYKFKPSRVSGMFRSSSPTPLDFWHLSENFAIRPVLAEAFVQDNSNLPVDRATQSGPTFGEQFLFDSFFDVRAVRCMPMFSIPGMGPRL